MVIDSSVFCGYGNHTGKTVQERKFFVEIKTVLDLVRGVCIGNRGYCAVGARQHVASIKKQRGRMTSLFFCKKLEMHSRASPLLPSLSV